MLRNKFYLGIFILTFFYLPLITVALADEYQCSVVWASGTFEGNGDSLGEAIDDARENCHHDTEVSAHECGGSPVNTNCVDEDGNCVSHAEFLKHGLAGGDECS